VDFLIEDREILSPRRPVNCFQSTHSKNLTTDGHGWTQIKNTDEN
jgi:hypothetical protein